MKYNFNIYPYDSEDLYEEERQLNEDIKSLIPFAIAGSETEIEINGEMVRGRKLNGVLSILKMLVNVNLSFERLFD